MEGKPRDKRGQHREPRFIQVTAFLDQVVIPPAVN